MADFAQWTGLIEVGALVQMGHLTHWPPVPHGQWRYGPAGSPGQVLVGWVRLN
jgi:hypothetical protein